jgi:DNA-binding SARP family transcriptional activator
MFATTRLRRDDTAQLDGATNVSCPCAEGAEDVGCDAVSATVFPPLRVHLLGSTRVGCGDRFLVSWLSGRGRAIFEYLIANRDAPIPRERLMNVFWPDASPDCARNSLNVAVHGLRQSLRGVVADRSVVIHRNRSYLIDPCVEVWFDVDEFERRLVSGRRHTEKGERRDAALDFEAAIGLYRGDFLADSPYEDWALVARESLRLAYLDGLDALSALEFDSGNYGGCVELCTKTLAYDSCREEIHRRLMRCYACRDQSHLALRQYHRCVATLRAELGLQPSASTTDLYQRIQRRERI